ncbi:MAG: hypothetical protein KC656_33325, partial [Myxococcales bacterium]|nr:hypothetical protein [Myxococcales bacterium]
MPTDHDAAAHRRGPSPLPHLLSLAVVLLLGAVVGAFAHRSLLRGQAPPDPERWEIRIGEYARVMIDAFSLSLEPGLYGGRLGLTLHAEAHPVGLPATLELPVQVDVRVDFQSAGSLTLWLPDGRDGGHFVTFDPRDPSQSGLFAADADAPGEVPG